MVRDCTPERVSWPRILRSVWDLGIQFWLQPHALLFTRIGSAAHDDERVGRAAVDGHVRDTSRDVDVVASTRHFVLLEFLAKPQVALAAQHVEGGLVGLVV